MLKIYIALFSLIFFNLSAEVVDKLEVKGNSRISLETIKVYGDITYGKDYSPSQLNEILKNLYETNFFENINISLSNGVLSVQVKEYAIINSVNLEGEKSNSATKQVLEKLSLQAIFLTSPLLSLN